MIIAGRRFASRSSAAAPTIRPGTASTAARCWPRPSTSTATSPAATCRRSSSTASARLLEDRVLPDASTRSASGRPRGAPVPEDRARASRSTTTATCRPAAAWARARRSPSACCTRCTRCRGGWPASSSSRIGERAPRAGGAQGNGRLAGPGAGRLRRPEPRDVPAERRDLGAAGHVSPRAHAGAQLLT